MAGSISGGPHRVMARGLSLINDLSVEARVDHISAPVPP
jgi:hypothetical protein